jgi:hypothetical protein
MMPVRLEVGLDISAELGCVLSPALSAEKIQKTMKTSSASTNNQFSLACVSSKTECFTALHRWVVRDAACLMSLLFVGSVYAQPLDVAVSSAQYTTYVEAEGWPPDTYPPISRTTVSSFPISDELDFPTAYSGPPSFVTNHAIACAGLFLVSDQTGWGMANASATSQLWFSPLADQTQSIGIQILAFGDRGPLAFTGGQISLLDLTTNSELWNYSWNENGLVGPLTGAGNVPWDPADPSTADFTINTDFLASHQYELTIMTDSNAGDDDQSVQIQLTGSEVVPEPSSVCLLLMALLGLPAARWRNIGRN